MAKNSVMIALSILALGITGARAQSIPLPDRLGRLMLAESVAGGKAKLFVDRLHDKEVSPQNSVMGRYEGDGKTAVLYVSSYHSQAKASSSASRMMNLIKKGNKTFSHYSEVRRGRLSIGRCLGLGQVHYFFRHQARVYWLSVDPGHEKSCLEDLLARTHIPLEG